MKIQIKDSMTGFAVLRKIEDHLFESDSPERGKEFWLRGKNTATHTDNQNSCGWSGHDRAKVISLAAEFGIEVELVK